MEKATTESGSLLAARAELESIDELHSAWLFCRGELEGQQLSAREKACLRRHFFPDDCLDDVRESIEEEARESIVSIEARSGWELPGRPLVATEGCITLSTGGPAVRIVGEIDCMELSYPRLEHQDSFTHWERMPLDDGQRAVLNWFVNLFCWDQDQWASR